jgi:hypothetical protein
MIYIYNKNGFREEKTITLEEALYITELSNRESEYKSYVYEGDVFPPVAKKIDPITGALIDKTDQDKLDTGEISLSDLKLKLQISVNQIRDEIIYKGNPKFIEFESKLFDADRSAKDNIQEILSFIQNGGTLPNNFVWRSAENENIPMDTERFKNFANIFSSEYLIWKQSVYTLSWNVKNTIQNLKKANILKFNLNEAMNYGL